MQLAPPPLVFSFLDLKKSEIVTTPWSAVAELPVVTDVLSFTKRAENSGAVNRIVEESIIQRVAVPVVLAIKNDSSSGVRDLYVEISIRADRKVQIAQSLGWSNVVFTYASVWDPNARRLNKL